MAYLALELVLSPSLGVHTPWWEPLYMGLMWGLLVAITAVGTDA